MSPPDKDTDNLLALKLDEQRRQEIREITERFEDQWRTQALFEADMKNKMDVVAEQQKNLKERFEEGVSKRLTKLDEKFDKLLTEWGAKKTEDMHRDKSIDSMTTKVDRLDKKVDIKSDANMKLWNRLTIAVAGSLCVAILFWAFARFGGG